MQCVNSVHHELDDTLVSTQFLVIRTIHTIVASQFPEKGILGNDQRRNELALLGNNHNLVNVLVHAQLGLYKLRCNVFAVTGLEQVLDPIGKEKFTVLDIADIACVEPSILINGQISNLCLTIISLGDCLAL